MSVSATPSTPDVPTSKLAIASLIVGIISAFFVLPIFGGVIAIFLGYLAKSEIDASLGTLKGSGMATAGQILGALHLVVAVVIFCCFMAYLVVWPFLSRGG
jgi:hypothetical protein